MGALKNKEYISDPENLTNRYGGVPVIFVESDEDTYVFRDCWFRDLLSKVEFKPALDKAKLSGCGGVIEAVNTELANGNSAWGIVDRDTTMSKDLWHLVDETNDESFEQAKPFGPRVKVLKLWEMESYLVDCEALEHHRAAIKKQQPRILSQVHIELLAHCDSLVPHAAINAVLHAKKEKGFGDGYTDTCTSRDAVDAQIKSNNKFSLLDELQKADYENAKSKVDRFDDLTKSPEERVNLLLRRVYGKAILSRFRSQHQIQADLDGLLAKRIEEQKRVPVEISDFVSQVCSS